MSTVRHVSPLGDATAGDHKASILDVVMRCRRRAYFLLVVRYGTVAGACAMVLTAAVLYLSSTPGESLLWVGPAAGVGFACGLAAAFWRCPAPLQVAMEVDRRLGLDDSLVAAWQARGSNAPIAPLVLRHAVRRAAHLDARQVFPIDARWPGAALGLAAASLLLVLLPGLRGESPLPGGPLGAGRVISSGDASSSFPSQPERPPQTAASNDAPSLTSVTNDAGNGRPAEPASRTADGTADGTRSQAASADAPVGASLEATSAGLSRLSSPAASSSPVNTDGGPGRGSSSASARDSSLATAGGASRSGLGAAGRGGASASGTGLGAGSGGVRGGALIGADPTATVASPPSASYAARYAQARRSAEAAMARDEVPLDLRSYVRQYFLAIAPPPERK